MNVLKGVHEWEFLHITFELLVFVNNYLVRYLSVFTLRIIIYVLMIECISSYPIAYYFL